MLLFEVTFRFALLDPKTSRSFTPPNVTLLFVPNRVKAVLSLVDTLSLFAVRLTTLLVPSVTGSQARGEQRFFLTSFLSVQDE